LDGRIKIREYEEDIEKLKYPQIRSLSISKSIHEGIVKPKKSIAERYYLDVL
jgi:hypothetical protein